MTEKTRKELQKIQKNYAKYGITLELLEKFVKERCDGISEKAAVICVRAALSKEFNEHEYFTVQDVAEATGTTVEEVNKRIEENKDELMKMGVIIEVTSSINGLFN